jgi:hypothetical protein
MPTAAVGMFSHKFTCPRKREHGTQLLFQQALENKHLYADMETRDGFTDCLSVDA